MQWLVKVALFVWLFPFIHIPKDTKHAVECFFFRDTAVLLQNHVLTNNWTEVIHLPLKNLHHFTIRQLAHRGLISPFVSLTFEKFTF